MFEKEKDEIFFGVQYGYSRCRDAIIVLFENMGNSIEFVSNLYNLVKYISERNISLTILIQHDLYWDAQILMRCVQEAAMKVCFLCNCSENEQQKRMKEFLYDLEEINRLKQSEIAKKVVASTYKDISMQVPFLPLILTQEQEDEIRKKWSSKKRGELEKKWSFTEMLREQANRNEELRDKFLSLAHPYKMSSHLIHADETAIGIVAERSLREKTEREKVEMAHFCSLLSESLNYLIVCGYAISFAFKKDSTPFRMILDEMRPIFQKMEIASQKVYQDESYDKFRSK